MDNPILINPPQCDCTDDGCNSTSHIVLRALKGGVMGILTTGVKNPRNSSPRSHGTIHDDKVASNLGFRGGAIAGSIHLDQFGPVLVDAFGQQWFETGSLGLYFLHPLLDQEPVEGFVDVGNADTPLSNSRCDVRMTTPDNTAVAEGTASVGQVSNSSPVTSRDRRSMQPSDLRMLSNVHLGMELEPVVESPSQGDQRDRVTSGLMTSPMDWYVNDSPWGGAICSPLTISRLMTSKVMQPLERAIGKAVGLYGALELKHVNGPLFLDEDYVVSGVLTDVSETPKTEVFWCDMNARLAKDPDAGIVATFTVMTRLVKASSPLYQS